MLGWRFEGWTASKIWIKTRKIVGSAVLVLNCTQVFTRVEGGDRSLQSAVWHVGVSWQIVTKPLWLILTSILVYVFYDYFLHGSYGPSYVKQILSGVKKSKDSIETRHDNFSHPYSKAANTLGWFVNCWWRKKRRWCSVSFQLPIGGWRKMFTRGGEPAWSLNCRAIQVVLITNFK